MTPLEFAAEKHAMWQRALREQRDAEALLAAARKKQNHHLILELMPKVAFLRTKADLLLADAVKIMCLWREQSALSSGCASRDPLCEGRDGEE